MAFIDGCKGRVLFIDEAYASLHARIVNAAVASHSHFHLCSPDLDPGDKTLKGALVLNHIMKYTTHEHFGDFCFVLAGYKHKIEEAIFK